MTRKDMQAILAVSNMKLSVYTNGRKPAEWVIRDMNDTSQREGTGLYSGDKAGCEVFVRTVRMCQISNHNRKEDAQ